jgi:dipeptide/tripeptide permease
LPWALSIGAGTWELLAPELRYGLSEVESTTLHALNPLVVIALSLLAAVAFVVLHALKGKVPALLVAGLGLAVLGVAAALSAALIAPDAGFGTVGFVLVIGAIGEALFLPLLLSRATGDLPLRLETAVAAAWTLAVRVIMMLTAFVSEEPSGQRALLWVGALAALVVGVGLAAASFPLRRVFARPEPASGSLPSAASAG